VSAIAGFPERADKVQSAKNGDLPWKPFELAQMVAVDRLKPSGDANEHKRQYEMRWRKNYAPYKWLCRLKHPTLPSILHDAAGTINDMGSLVIMAREDLRDEDRGTQVGVAVGVLHRTLASLLTYTHGGDIEDAPAYRSWSSQWTSAWL
jgi:hypothetical protein